MADGSFRDAVKSLEQVSFIKGAITPDIVRSILAVSETKIREEFVAHLRNKDAAALLEGIGRIVADGKDIKFFLADILTDLERRLVQSVRNADTDDWKGTELHGAIRKLQQAYTEMKSASLTQLPLELAVVEYCGENRGEVKIRDSAVKHPAEKTAVTPVPVTVTPPVSQGIGMLTLDHLTNHWNDVIAELKPFNHSVAGVMRSTRPKAVGDGIVTIEAFYTFHKDKLSESRTKEVIASVLKKLFGETVKVEIVLGKK
jgi:DNA polymerase III gamma/tau subunit